MGDINTRLGKPDSRPMRVLIDSGTTKSIILKSFTQKLRCKKTQPVQWRTKAGNFTTDEVSKIQFRLPDLYKDRIIEYKVHVDTQTAPDSCYYDMILGSDICQALGLIIDYKEQVVRWDTAYVPMVDREIFCTNLSTINDLFEQSFEGNAVQSATSRMTRILDNDYHKADLPAIVQQCTHLTTVQQQLLLRVLQKHEPLFDGTLGKWNVEPLNIKLKPGVTPYHSRAFPIPKIHEETLKKEVRRLERIGVLRRVNHSEWAAPTFIIPKKDGKVRFVSDFRELNKRIVRNPYPLPKIQDLMLKLEGFQYASALDLNMGYYHIHLTPASRRLCTIVLPWGKYEYTRLPMGVKCAPDIFQERMTDLFQGMEYIRAYLDDLLILSKGDWTDHCIKLDNVLQRLGEAGLKVNCEKSFFGRTETEYLGFWITRHNVRPQAKKVEAIHNIQIPKTRKQLRRFIGMINYYRDMWPRRSDLLAPLTKLTSKTVPWKWTAVEQKAFEDMKKVITKETMLTYPDFNKPFDIHTDASDVQLGAVISQEGKPIAFYSRKLNSAQARYTVGERELLSIVETLKEFRNILLGQSIKVYTDHKNLTCKNYNSDRVMRWRLLIEEFGPELIHLPGKHNIVADALSRLDTNPAELLNALDISNDIDISESEYTNDLLAELNDFDKLPDDIYPLTYKIIDQYQQQDPILKKTIKQSTMYTLEPFRGGGKDRQLICYKGKIVIPTILRSRVLTWYHEYLCHPGIVRTLATISQHLYWPNMKRDVINHVGACDRCQRLKKQKKKYGHLPEKIAEGEPWEKLCVDLIGPYTIERTGRKPINLQAVTMIDPATSWFEIVEYPDKQSITIANLVEQTWLSRYPWPTEINYDQGTEFIGHHFKTMVEEEYGIKARPITVRNPQANAVLERIHQVLGNIIRTFEMEDRTVDYRDPWTGILSATAFAVRSTYHTTLQATPGQLVFGRDLIFNIKHEANWKAINERKQRIIAKNNKYENSKRLSHDYKVGDKVLLERHDARKMERPYDGPYKITQVYTNGTVTIKKGAVYQRHNIRRIQPYYDNT